MQFLFELGFVQPALGRAAYFVAVVEHETSAVGMAEIIEGGDLVLASIFAPVQIIAHFVRGLKIDELQIIGRPYGIDDTEQVLFLLSLPTLVPWAVHHPSDVSGGTVLFAEFSDPDSAGSDKVHPPIVVGFDLILFPFHD